MVKVTTDVEDILERNSIRIGRVFPDRRGPSEIRFGVGDTVSVTMFEAAAGGLFIPADAGVRPGNYVTLPNQQVDTQGNITVPYAGAIKAQGRTAVQVQASIVSCAQEPRARTAGGGCAGRSARLLDQRARRSRHAIPLPGKRQRRTPARCHFARRRPAESRLRHLGHARTRRTPGGRAIRRASRSSPRTTSSSDRRTRSTSSRSRRRSSPSAHPASKDSSRSAHGGCRLPKRWEEPADLTTIWQILPRSISIAASGVRSQSNLASIAPDLADRSFRSSTI